MLTTSTRPSRLPRRSRRRGWAARWRSGPWWRPSDPRARLQGGVGARPRFAGRLLGDFDLAEEASQEAFAVAAERWPRDGVPSSPANWLITTARRRAIDRIRRD